jgi:integrase
MARKVRDSNLDTRTARDKLKPRGKPYYRTIDKGLHLGYRKLRGAAGTWVGRFYVGDEDYEVERIATADDLSDANGHDILDYWQAVAEARRRRDQRAKDTAAGRKSGPYTVGNALADYFNWLRTDGRPEHLVADAERRAKAMIEPGLGSTVVESLTAKKLREWRDELVKAGARLRTVPGQKQKYRDIEDDDDLRKRRASANRLFATLRAALNHSFKEGMVSSDHEWRKVKAFKGVDGRRTAFLEVDEATRLVNACTDSDFRLLVQAALLTGGRYSSLTRLKVGDFHAHTGTVHMTTRKGDDSERQFPVTLTDEGVAFFRRLCLGRTKGDLMLTHNGHEWGKNHQVKLMERACERAKLEPIGFNQLRHTWATIALMGGVPDLIVAQNLGHTSTKMIEAHYAHITRKYAKERIQAGAPQFGFKPDRKIVTLR